MAQQARAVSTNKARSTAETRWLNFLHDYDITIPASGATDEQLVAYISYLYNEPNINSAGTIASYLSQGVRIWHLRNNLPWIPITDRFYPAEVLAGSKRLLEEGTNANRKLVSHLSRRKESILDALNFVCDVVAGNDCDMVYSLAKRFSHAYNLTAQMLMVRAVTLSRVPEDMRRVERCVRTVFRLRSEKQLSKTGRILHGEKRIILGLRIVIAQACEAMKSEHIQAAIDVVDAIYREAGMDMWALCPAESSLALSAVMAHDRRVARHVLGPTPRLRSACKARRSGAEMALKIKSRAWLRRAACV